MTGNKHESKRLRVIKTRECLSRNGVCVKSDYSPQVLLLEKLDLLHEDTRCTFLSSRKHQQLIVARITACVN